jgi:uncharacterized protein YjbI with pentapeptide repeats
METQTHHIDILEIFVIGRVSINPPTARAPLSGAYLNQVVLSGADLSNALLFETDLVIPANFF